MTNPKKKREVIIEIWTNLKQKLMTTIQELKANHKDKWAVVKHKSVLERKEVKVLSHYSLKELKSSLREKQSLLQAMEQRPPTQLLSPSDQTKHDQLVEEINSLNKEIEWQESFKNLSEAQAIDDKHTLFVLQQELEKENSSRLLLRQELIQVNEKHDRLNDKLNWLRTLVRAGDIKQLQELVRGAKI